jgi:GT2 family glycosyltransferase
LFTNKIQFPPPPTNLLFVGNKTNSGPAKARNLGKKIALENNSDIIAFTDTDCILSENWIETIINSFQNKKEFQILSGNTVSFDKNWFGVYHNLNGTLNGRKFKNSENLLYGTTANLAITKEVAQNIDFSEDFPLAAGEDIEFCFRANQAGFAITHIPQMIVFHNYGYANNLLKSLKLFYCQFKRYGQGEVTLLQKVPEYYAYFDKTEEIYVRLSFA